MQILLINQNWFAAELKQMGHEVLTVGTASHLDIHLSSPLIHIDSLLRQLPEHFAPDRIVWFDNSAPMTILGIEDCPIPSVLYSVDTHHHCASHSLLANSFDYTFVAQKDYLSSFSESEERVSWLPLWASEYMRPEETKKYGATFVGTLNPELNPNRVAFFEELQKKVPVKVLQGNFPSIFPYAEIVINQTVKKDLNFRVFEAMMSGALLLTEKTDNGLLELFEDGKHLVTYKAGDVDDAAAKITALLADLNRCRKIGAAGRHEVLEKHCPSHRAKAVNDLLVNLSKREPHPKRHLGPLLNCLTSAVMLQDVHPATASQLLSICLDLSEKTLDLNAQLGEDDCLYIVRAHVLFSETNNSQRCSKTLARLCQRYPESSLLPLIQTKILHSQGLIIEANSLAQQIRPDLSPEETMQLAQQAVDMIMPQMP